MAVISNSNYYHESGPLDGRAKCLTESELWSGLIKWVPAGGGPLYKGLITVVVESGKEGIYMWVYDGKVNDEFLQQLTEENYLQYWKKLATSSVFGE